jgi:hypothetical protein
MTINTVLTALSALGAIVFVAVLVMLLADRPISLLDIWPRLARGGDRWFWLRLLKHRRLLNGRNWRRLRSNLFRLWPIPPDQDEEDADEYPDCLEHAERRAVRMRR